MQRPSTLPALCLAVLTQACASTDPLGRFEGQLVQRRVARSVLKEAWVLGADQGRAGIERRVTDPVILDELWQRLRSAELVFHETTNRRRFRDNQITKDRLSDPGLQEITKPNESADLRLCLRVKGSLKPRFFGQNTTIAIDREDRITLADPMPAVIRVSRMGNDISESVYRAPGLYRWLVAPPR